MTWAQFVMALTLWREARGASHAARIGIASVIRNRTTPRKDVVAVCTQPWQFSSMTAPGDPNLIHWPATGDPQMQDCLSIAAQTLGPDTTAGATFYFTAPLTEPPKAWGNVVGTVTIDGVHFYKSEPNYSEAAT